MNGINEVGVAMAAMATGNSDSQITAAQSVMFNIIAHLNLTKSLSGLLVADQEQNFRDDLLIATDPKMAAKAAADYMKYTMDSSSMDRQTSYQTNILHSQETELRMLGSGMSQVYGFAESAMQQQGVQNHRLLGFAGMN